MAKKPLGKGLDAILGDISQREETQETDSGYRLVETSLLQPNPNQPRQTFNEDALEELADSVREGGILNAIVVRELPNGALQIISGERRWRAAQLAGLERVAVSVRKADERETLFLGLIENMQREDLTSYEAAIAIRQLHEEFGLKHEEIAQKVGKSRTTVTNLLRLLTLSEPVLKLLKAGELEEGGARALLGLSSQPALQLSLARRAIKDGLNVRQIERAVRQHDQKKRPIPKKDPDVARLEEELADALGSSVNISRRGKRGGGTLQVHYRNLEHLQSIVERIRR